jgi:hypothetical protein
VDRYIYKGEIDGGFGWDLWWIDDGT